MNDDFLKQQKKPRPEFSETLYKRISKPMNTQENSFGLRRLALASAALLVLLALVVVLSPGAQAFAGSLFREIGSIILIDQGENPNLAAPEVAPTPPPPTVGPTFYARSGEEIADLAGFSPATVTYLPDGYTAAQPWSVVYLDTGTGVYRQYRDPSGEHFLTYNAVKNEPGARFEQAYGENESVMDVTIRGQAGVWITGRGYGDAADSLQPTNWLMWAEGDVNYFLYSDALPQAEMMRIAESMK